MHKKRLYCDFPLRLFLTVGVETDKTFTLKLIVQDLIRLCNKSIYAKFPNVKAWLITSISKATFNIDGLIIHSTPNIHVHELLAHLSILCA